MIGLFVLAQAVNNGKFCIFLVPICKISATLEIKGIYFSSITSVTTGILYLFFASASHSIPCSLVSLYFLLLYGKVKGLKAPPLKKLAPIFFTFFAQLTNVFLRDHQGTKHIIRIGQSLWVSFRSSPNFVL